MNFTAGQRFTIQNSKGETEVLTIVSTQELKNEMWVNIRLGNDPVVQSYRAIEVAQTLMQQGNQIPLEDPQGLTPEQALMEYERRQAQKGPPAPMEPTIDQLPDLTDEQKAAMAARKAAAEAAASAPQRLVGQPKAPTPRQDAAAVEARIMGLPEPELETGDPRASIRNEPPAAGAGAAGPAGKFGDWTLWSDAARAIEEWHKAQQDAITRRLSADEKRAMAMLDASEGKVPGKKFSNEQARRAYVDEICLTEEGRALRAESAVKALQFWIEHLDGGRR